MKFDNNVIERMAVRFIRDEFEKCYNLDTEKIPVGDKDISYDGYITVYEYEHNWKKENAKYIPVQVKGTTNFNQKTLTFPISVIDLINYKNRNGVMFFVVSIDKSDTSKKKLFYKDLLSPDLNELLEKPNKNTISVKLKEFDTTSSDVIKRVLLKFDADKRRLATDDIYYKNFERFDDLVINIVDIENPVHGILGEHLVFGKTSDFPNKLFPIDRMIKDSVSVTVNASISIGRVSYFHTYEVSFRKKNTIVKFGESIIFEIGNECDSNFKISIETTHDSDVNGLINDLNFIQELTEKRYFYVNENKVNLVAIGGFISKSDDYFVLQIIKLWKFLKIDTFIDVKSLTKFELNNLNLLVEYFVNENSKVLEKLRSTLYSIKIRNITLNFILIKGESANTNKLLNIFDDDFKSYFIYEYEDNVREEHSIYLRLKAKEFERTPNFNFSHIYNEVMSDLNKSERYIYSLNNFCLGINKCL